MKNLFTHFSLLTLIGFSLALLAGLLLWLIPTPASCLVVHPLQLIVFLPVLAGFSFLLYRFLRVFLLPLRRVYSTESTDNHPKLFPYSLIFVGMMLFQGTVQAQVSGTVFRDFNANGIRTATNPIEPFLAGITVKAYDASGAEVGSTTSSGTGAYSFTGLTLPLRIEFSGYATGDFSGPNGTGSLTSVQFHTIASTTANFGVNYPSDYCHTTNPSMVTSLFVSGDPLSGGTSGTGDVLVRFGYTNSGVGINSLAGFGVAQTASSPTVDAEGLQIGSTWGIAYQKSTKTVFNSAFIKRHVGLGPLGEGGIYSINYSSGSPVVSQWLDVATIGMNVGTVGTGATFADRRASRNLNAASNLLSGTADTDAFFKVGRAGIGDIDISEDEKTLWVVNLFDRTLNGILIDSDGNPATAPTNADLTTFAIPNPCGTGTQRPFALKVYRGEVYIGLVCETSLEAYIYRFNGTAFTQVLVNGAASIPLNYIRGQISATGTCYTASGSASGNNGWFVWSDATPPAQCHNPSAANKLYVHPEPLLSDIEFDVDGSIILGIIDRSGHMYGAENLQFDGSDFESVHAGGDVLRVCNVGGSLFMQGSPGGCANNSSNNSGPNGGEFYHQDYLTCAFFCPPRSGEVGLHTETTSGGMALLPGSGTIAVASYDPFGTTEVSGGVNWYNNTTGLARSPGYLIYFGQNNDFVTPGGFFGKANGIGDLELLCDAAPIEIGNRIWNDRDRDGIQDANEAVIANVSLEIFADFNNDGTPDGAALGTATTNPTGNWYFNAANIVDGDPSVAGNQAGPQPNKNYLVRIAAADWTGGAGAGDLANFYLTDSNIGGTGQPDVRDNDASIVNNIPTIPVSTGARGENNHTFDMGFFNCTPNAGTDGATTICDNSVTVIDLFSLITGEVTGGTWTRLTGTGGTFNAGAGTFTPAAGATTSTFQYEVTNAAPCINDQSVATVNIVAQVNAGVGGSLPVCGNTGGTIDLFSVITGEQTGGTWTRTTGTGGTFTAAAGTFLPPATAGTHTFTYTRTGTTPCPNDAAVATIVVTAPVTGGADVSTTVCINSATAVNLATLLTGETAGGTWSRATGTGGTYTAGASTFIPTGATTSTFHYIILGTAPCPNDTGVVTVVVQPLPVPGTAGSTTVCSNNSTPIDLFSLITGEQAGGTWTRTTGAGGTFVAATGTFTPAAGATNSTFTYTVTGAPCANATAIATVNITATPTGGVDASTTVCINSATAINLATLLTGETAGGVWSRTSGTGGTYTAGASTFTPTGATTSTFIYVVTGTGGCLNDTGTVTVNVVPLPVAGSAGSVTVCGNSGATIDLFSIITGEPSGGVWTRGTGTTGTFDGAAGTFIPPTTAGTFTFNYTVTATPCAASTATATVIVVAAPNAGTDGATTICNTSVAAVTLANFITGEQAGGTWVRTTGTGGTFVSATGVFTPAAGATTSTFTYTVNGTAPCANDESVVTVNIVPAPVAGTSSTLAVCEASTADIDLSTIITGEQSGGVWVRTTGTGGTFVAATGMFTPAVGATNSNFTYTLIATGCATSTSTATVTISASADAGTDGSVTVCSTTAQTLILANYIIGEQTGGTWARTGGTGGTFTAGTGTFVTAPTATTSTFTYTRSNGVAPCPITDVSTVTVNFCAQTPCQTGNTGGVVWQDYDNDGVQDASEPQGVGGVTVRAYDCNGNLIGTTTTDVLGQFTFGVLSPAPTTGAPVRIEFSGLPSPYVPTSNGTDGRTDVQFITAPECNVDYGVVAPADYCQANPNLITPVHYNGELTTANSMLRFAYTSPGTITGVSTTNQTGTTWGVTYKRSTNQLFTSAFLKRHSAMGNGGPGAIYVINPNAAANGSLFFDLNTVESTGAVPTNATRGLVTASAGLPNTDALAFPLVGKVSLGDVDISDDEQYLYTINLANQKLYRIPTVSPTAGAVTSWAIPNPGCLGGIWRPFALKFYRNKVYVGGICDASSSQTRSDLRAYVYEFDPVSGTFTTELNFALDFDRGNASPFACTSAGLIDKATHWNPWTDVHTVFNDCGIHDVYPQPMLSDIEFDIDGSMIMGFFDRWGHQTGEANNYPNGVFGEQGVTGGDVMRAYNNSGVFELENNGVVGPLAVSATSNPYNTTSTYAPNGQGLGGKEFYYADTWVSTHDERSAGGLAMKPGSGEVVMTAMDPAFGIYSQGAIWMNNTTGLQNTAFTAYSGGIATFGKGYGIGDIELLCDALPIEIGNYVWIDTDGDGVQDPCELPLVGVRVELYKKDGTLIGQTTTGANGEYYFNNTNVDTIPAYGTGGFTGMSPNTQYLIVIGRNMSQFNTTTNYLTIGANIYALTASNTGAGAGADQNDNDGTLLSGFTGGGAVLNGFPGYCVTTPAVGSNHTYDFGFKLPCNISSVAATPDACVPATNQYTLTGAVTFTNAPTTGTLTVQITGGGSQVFNAPFTSPTNYSIAGQTSDGASHTVTATFSADNACTNTVNYMAPANCTPCAISNVTATPSTCVPATNQYTVTGAVTFTNAPTTGTLTVQITGGGSQVFNAPFTSPANYSIAGQTSDGASHTVTATFSADTNCTEVRMYNAPPACSGCPTGNCKTTTFVKN
ncbi:MAG: hypothetical protein RIR11_523 [Bacteroidota bacterium]